MVHNFWKKDEKDDGVYKIVVSVCASFEHDFEEGFVTPIEVKI